MLQATPLTWTINGVYDNGATLTGTFTFDATTSAVSAWNLTGATGFVYTPANSTFSSGQCCTDQFAFNFSEMPDLTFTLQFAFNPDLTNAGGTGNIAGGQELFYLDPVNSWDRTLVSGTASPATPTSVPEPSEWPLASGAVFVFAAAKRTASRRKWSLLA